jgi:hypothetical protein
MDIALVSYLERKKTFPELRLLKRRLLIWLSEKSGTLCDLANC